MARVYWTQGEIDDVLREVIRLDQGGDRSAFRVLVATAQTRVLPPPRRRSTRLTFNGSPYVQGMNPTIVARYKARIETLKREPPPPTDTRQAQPDPTPERPEPMRLSAQDDLANYGLADLLAATLTRLLDTFRPAPVATPILHHFTTNPVANGVHAPVPFPSDSTPARERKIRIAGIGFLPSQQAAIQNRVPEVDFTWIDAEQSHTYVPPSMDFAVISRFCQHRWSEYCWKTFGQARAPRVTGGISEVTQAVRTLVATRAQAIANLTA